MRRHRSDNSQKAIVEALRAIGARVWHIGEPCDLLTLYRGRWLPLECKTTKRVRKDQQAQNDFIATTGTPRVTTGEEAIAAVLRGSSS